ncbi:histidine--tRNA ligase [Oharaeibacter diazotrophicus]|uniref:Histidine--tRNA ligase n=1 Tax=Oharaeibacter diazotrophicus TaxID=1920512 RepID=A0A4R6RBF5_9HYPH|nr:histidine--tRNA ligase [Oharaeibacter diazotrophicus]TDP83473.1 histidyl-tRNA synthetase [Oharaeibacter diazotrophicus]BBE72306.1 histidine-tRNA ligase [Pleomorphomonas sp. SM30]GLS79076.1 histidine--tRNA ligase [Oharaeibacter diazotrophicus]
MSDTIKARAPRGFVDRTPAEIKAADEMLRVIRHTYELYGFEAVETPLVEYTDALGKFLPDQDRPNEGVFSFQDDDEQWLSLRYDLTAPLARFYAENHERLPKPYRSYRTGWVFRNEKPGPGRFRQFMQFDADTVGAASVAADAEICMMAADTLEALGIARGDYVVRVNNRKVLDGVMEAIGIGGPEHAATRLTVLRAIDKLDKIGLDGVQDLLGDGRWENPEEKSGDFTKGAGLNDEQIKSIRTFVAIAKWTNFFGDSDDPAHFLVFDEQGEPETKGARTPLEALNLNFGDTEKAAEGIEELAQIQRLCRAAGYGWDRIRIDTSVVRGLEYYTGPVFEAELTFQVTGEDGRPVRFGSVGGGGRYDGLVGRFLKEAVPATGFSIGVSRLLAALRTLGKVGAAAEAGPVVVLVMDKDPAALADYQAMTAELRAAGIRAEMYLGASGMKAQMKYADRRNAPVAVIVGSDERANGKAQLKDLALGKTLSAGITDNARWRAERPAQKEIARADLVAEVRAMVEAGR